MTQDQHQHTPGPWYVGGHPGDNSGTAWRQVLTDSQAFGPSYVCQALEDDARLIAAAPNLLAELERSQKWLAKVAADHDNDGTGLSERAMKQHARNQAAIDAAKGEAP